MTQANEGVPGAKVWFQEGVDGPCTEAQNRVHDLASAFSEPLEVTTDASGAFSAHVYSDFSPYERCLIVTAAADDDTVTVEQTALFREERKTPAAVHIAFMLQGAP
ncbi:MAG TPA: hypothetical protein VHH32_10645 [Gemmatimonadales bacterium]|nr:hypothetical protein [Gemmatimonadales bacterium]